MRGHRLSPRVENVSENFTGGKHGATRTRNNAFEVSRGLAKIKFGKVESGGGQRF